MRTTTKHLNHGNRRLWRDSNRTQVRSITGSRNLWIRFENNEGFRGKLILTFRTLEKRPLRCFETSETDYPVTRHHIPKERNPQLHRCKNLRTVTESNSTPQKYPASYMHIYIYIYIYAYIIAVIVAVFDVHLSVHRKYISKLQPTRCNFFSIYLFL